MATITTTPRARRPGALARGLPASSAVELRATINIDLIYTFIDQIPQMMGRDNLIDHDDMGMKEHKSNKLTWQISAYP